MRTDTGSSFLYVIGPFLHIQRLFVHLMFTAEVDCPTAGLVVWRPPQGPHQSEAQTVISDRKALQWEVKTGHRSLGQVFHPSRKSPSNGIQGLRHQDRTATSALSVVLNLLHRVTLHVKYYTSPDLRCNGTQILGIHTQNTQIKYLYSVKITCCKGSIEKTVTFYIFKIIFH